MSRISIINNGINYMQEPPIYFAHITYFMSYVCHMRINIIYVRNTKWLYIFWLPFIKCYDLFDLLKIYLSRIIFVPTKALRFISSNFIIFTKIKLLHIFFFGSKIIAFLLTSKCGIIPTRNWDWLLFPSLTLWQTQSITLILCQF